MINVFTVNYLAKQKDLAFDGGIIKALSKFGYFCIKTNDDGKVRVLLFGTKEKTDGTT